MGCLPLLINRVSIRYQEPVSESNPTQVALNWVRCNMAVTGQTPTSGNDDDGGYTSNADDDHVRPPRQPGRSLWVPAERGT